MGEVIPPLRKIKRSKASGGSKIETLYARPDEIERLLEGLVGLAEDELLARAALRRRSAPGWLPGECLVFMMRRAGRRKDKRAYGRWVTLILERITAVMTRGGSDRAPTTLELQMSEYGVDRFVRLLGPDLTGYEDKLDIYEAKFDMAVLNLRRDALATFLTPKGEEPIIEISIDDEQDIDAQLAKSDPDLFNYAQNNDEDFRSRVWAAIDALPREQKEILTMMRDGMTPGEIAKHRGTEPRTLLNRKNAAMAAVRAAVERSNK